MKKLILWIAGLALAAGPLVANAALLDGQTVRYQYLFPNTSSNYCGSTTAVVGAGVEIAPTSNSCASIYYAYNFNVDLSDTSILVTYVNNVLWNSGAFNGFRIDDFLGTIPDFNATLGFTDIAGFDASRLSFDADNIFVNWYSLYPLKGNTLRIDLASEVPEPATLTLLALCLAGFGLARRMPA